MEGDERDEAYMEAIGAMAQNVTVLQKSLEKKLDILIEQNANIIWYLDQEHLERGKRGGD